MFPGNLQCTNFIRWWYYLSTLLISVQSYSLAGDMIKHQVIDLLFNCPCQVYYGVVMFPMTAQHYISFTAVYPQEPVV